jgi:PAS domain S-box-containing protein
MNDLAPPYKSPPGRYTPLRIAAIYTIAGSLWILLSDRLLATLTHDPATLSQLQTLKGWFYVLATGALLYALVRRDVAVLLRSAQAQRQSETQLHLIVAQARAVLWTTDRDLRFTSSRGAGLAALDLLPDQVVGQTLCEYLRTDDPDFPPIATHRRALGGESTAYEQTWGDVTYQTYLQPLRDATGEIAGVVGISFDVTGRKRAEEALRESEERYRLLLENSADAILMTTPDGRILSANPAARRMFERTEAEICQMGRGGVVDLTDPRLPVALEERKRTGRFRGELTLLRRDGQPFPGEVTSVVFQGQDGQPRTSMIIRDVSERKRTEQALRESEAHFRALVEQSLFGIVLIQDGKLAYINPRFTETVGYSPEELIGSSPLDVVVEADRDMVSENLRKRLSGEVSSIHYTFRARHKNGMEIDLEAYGSTTTYQGRPAILSTLLDITERVQIQRALQERERLLRETGRIAKIGGWEFDAETLTGTWTDEVARIHELDPDRETNVEIGVSFYHGESREKIETAIREAIELGKPYDLELEIVTAKGNHKWIRTIGHPIKKGGKVVKIRGSFQDITERKRAKDEIHRRARELAAINTLGRQVSASLSLDQVVAAALEGIAEAVAPDLALLFLREGDRLILRGTGPKSSPFTPPETPEHHVGECLCGLAAGEGEPVYARDIYTDPRCTWDECREAGLHSFAALPLRGEDGTIGVLGVASGAPRDFEGQAVFLETLADQVALGVQNATLYAQVRRHAAELEQRVAQRTAELQVAMEKVQETDRLKSAFLATMSHELRTPLNSIIGFTGIILQGLAGPLNAEQAKQLGMVQNSARHLLALINDVLDISKIEAGQLEIVSEPFDVRDMVDKAIHTVAPLAGKKRLKLVAEVAPEVGQITSDRRRVEQILLNLLNNAIKFTDQGEVRVECRIDEGRLATRVMDTGMGIRPKDMGKLFQMFQQIDSGLTRQQEGTGLGLSICKRLVEMLGGEIWTGSEWGKGSTFTFTLPIGGQDEAQGLGD